MNLIKPTLTTLCATIVAMWINLHAQIMNKEIWPVIIELWGDSMATKYKEIYFIHPTFCTGTRYCGSGIQTVLKQIPAKHTCAVITSSPDFYLFSDLEKKHIDVIGVSLYTLQQRGIFSVFPYRLRKKRIKYFR